MDKKKILWSVVSLVIAGLTIWTIVSQNKSFSFATLLSYIDSANKGWLIGAVLCMFGYIFFEGLAITRVAHSLGFKNSITKGTVYGAADVYFSAITPSATGGQPASAFFMMRDGISGVATTTILLINLIMYTLSLFAVGLVCMIWRFDMFLGFSVLSKVLIGVGIVILVGLVIIFYMLLRRASLMYAICNFGIKLLQKLHLASHGDEWREKLKKTMAEYQTSAQMVTGHWRLLLDTFLLNLAQRVSQLAVSFMIFMSLGKGFGASAEVFAMQTFVAMGSNSIPIPGAIGVADYLMIDGFTMILGEGEAATMEMLCRGTQFYLCIIVSILIVFAGYFMKKGVKKC